MDIIYWFILSITIGSALSSNTIETSPTTTTTNQVASTVPNAEYPAPFSTFNNALYVTAPGEDILIDSKSFIENSMEPDAKESLAIQKSLDWLRERRFNDFGWGNDTSIVILAKEVKCSINLINLIFNDYSLITSYRHLRVKFLTMIQRLLLSMTWKIFYHKSKWK